MPSAMQGERAKQLMADAHKIYFLGFGFGQLNVDRLGLGQFIEGRAVATAFGFTQYEANMISRRCGAKTLDFTDYIVRGFQRPLKRNPDSRLPGLRNAYGKARGGIYQSNVSGVYVAETAD